MPTTVHFNYPPYWLWNKGTGELEGFFVDLLQEMFGSMELNYTLENKIDDDMNGHAKDYGVLGKIYTEKYINIYFFVSTNIFYLVQGLVDGDYDVVVGDLTIDSKRLELIDFSIPIQMADLIIMKRQSSTLDADMFAIIQPFSANVWIAIVVSGIVATFFLALTIRVSQEKQAHPSLFSMWFIIGSTFGQGVSDIPR